MKHEETARILSDIDPVFLEEAANYTPAKVRRPVWKRMVLVAACLAAALAVTAGAASLLGDWDFYFAPDDEGTELAWAGVAYGAVELPEESKQIIREAVEGVPEDTRPMATLTFDTLAEMEAFLGIDLLESALYPVNAGEEIRCMVDYSSGNKYIGGAVTPYETFRIRGEYALDKGDWNNWMRFWLSTSGEASVAIGKEAEEGVRFQEYELEQLSVVASVMTGVVEGRHSDVYLVKDNVAYNISCTHDPELPADFLDSLY